MRSPSNAHADGAVRDTHAQLSSEWIVLREWSLENHRDEFISAWLKEPELLRKMSTTVIG
jgi:hypothetical protein